MEYNSLFCSESLLNEMKIRKMVTEQLIKRLQRDISVAPEGALRIISNKKKYQYYHRHTKQDSQGEYIPVKLASIATALAQKDYDERLLKTLEQQSKAIERFLKEFDPDAAIQVFEKLNEPRKQLVTPVFLSDKEYVDKWLSMTYEKLGFGKDDPEFYTAKGERVRSKSEVMISDALIRNSIPYRYEYPVYEDGVLIAAPDFNCLNVRLRKEYYWEHLGMMGNDKYADRNVKKLEKYTYAKDFDERRLILTFESDKHPLNTRIIEAKIRKFLL